MSSFSILDALIGMADRQLRTEEAVQQRQQTLQSGGIPLTRRQQKRGVTPLHPPSQLQLQWPQQYQQHNGEDHGADSMQLGADGDEAGGGSGSKIPAADLWGVGAGNGTISGQHRWTPPPIGSLAWDNHDEKSGIPLLLDIPTELPAFTSGGTLDTARLPFDTPFWRASHPRPDHVVAVHRLSVRNNSNGSLGGGVGVGIVQWMAHKVASRANRVAMAVASGNGSDKTDDGKQQCFNALAADYTRALWNIMSPLYKLQRLPTHAIKLKFDEASFMGFSLANDAMWDTSIDQLYDRVLKSLAAFYTNFADAIFRCIPVKDSPIREIKAGDFASTITDPVALRLSDHGEADQADEEQLIHIGSQRRLQQQQYQLPLLHFSPPSSLSVPLAVPIPSSPSSPSSLSLSFSNPSSPSHSPSLLQHLTSVPPPPSSVPVPFYSSTTSLSYPTPAYVPPSSPWSAVTISSPMSPQSPMSPSSSPHHGFWSFPSDELIELIRLIEFA